MIEVNSQALWLVADLLIICIVMMAVTMWKERTLVGEIHKTDMTQEDIDALFMGDDDDDDEPEIEEEGGPSEDEPPV